MKEGSLYLRCAVVVLVLSAAPGAAMAYIDPGNGAYMVQALFTLVGAAIFYLRHPIRSVKVMWHSLSSRWRSDGSVSRAEMSQRPADGAAGVSGVVVQSDEAIVQNQGPSG